jgi:lysophospholipase L1-like esterase
VSRAVSRPVLLALGAGVVLTVVLLVQGPTWRDRWLRQTEARRQRETDQRYRAETVAPGAIVFLGDSLTEFAELKALGRSDRALINRGISGDVSAGALRRLDEVIARRPAQVVLWIGINDLLRRRPAAALVANVEQMVARLRAALPDSAVVLLELLPVRLGEAPAFGEQVNRQVLEVNRELARVARAAAVPLVATHRLFLAADGGLDPTTSDDGLHLNAAGYARWRQAVAPQLRVSR